MEQLLDGIDNEVLLGLQRKIVAGTISNKEFLVLDGAMKGIIIWCARKAQAWGSMKPLTEIIDDKTIEAWQTVKRWTPEKGKLSSYLFATLPYPNTTKRTRFNDNAASLDMPFADGENNLHSRVADKKQDTEQHAMQNLQADKMLALADKILTDHQRDILLRSINGWKDTAQARELGISSSAVCLQRNNALKKLRAVSESPEIMAEVIKRTFSRYIHKVNRENVAGQEEIFDRVLTPHQKMVLQKHLDGVSEEKIGKELGVTPMAVHCTIKKATDKLAVLRAHPEKLAHISKRTFLQDTHMREILQSAFDDGTAGKVLNREQLDICRMYLDGKTQGEVGAVVGKAAPAVGSHLRKSVYLIGQAREYPDRIEQLRGFSKSKSAEIDMFEKMLGRPDGITDGQLHILQMRRNGYSSEEIGESYGTTRGAVNHQIRKAKNAAHEI